MQKPHRINESRDHFTPPPHPETLRLNADGVLERLEPDGGVSRLIDAETGEFVTFDTIPSEASQPDPHKVTRRPDPEPAPDPDGDGRGFNRSRMTPAQLAKAQARDERRAAPAPSTHPSASIADGQNWARSDMSPEQVRRLEARDRARGG